MSENGTPYMHDYHLPVSLIFSFFKCSYSVKLTVDNSPGFDIQISLAEVLREDQCKAGWGSPRPLRPLGDFSEIIRNTSHPQKVGVRTKALYRSRKGWRAWRLLRVFITLRALQGRQICVKNSFLHLSGGRDTRPPAVVKETHRTYAEEFTTPQTDGRLRRSHRIHFSASIFKDESMERSGSRAYGRQKFRLSAACSALYFELPLKCVFILEQWYFRKDKIRGLSCLPWRP